MKINQTHILPDFGKDYTTLTDIAANIQRPTASKCLRNGTQSSKIAPQCLVLVWRRLHTTVVIMGGGFYARTKDLPPSIFTAKASTACWRVGGGLMAAHQGDTAPGHAPGTLIGTSLATTQCSWWQRPPDLPVLPTGAALQLGSQPVPHPATLPASCDELNPKCPSELAFCAQCDNKIAFFYVCSCGLTYDRNLSQPERKYMLWHKKNHHAAPSSRDPIHSPSVWKHEKISVGTSVKDNLTQLQNWPAWRQNRKQNTVCVWQDHQVMQVLRSLAVLSK